MIEIYEKILSLKKSGGQGVLITVVDKEGHGPAQVQTKMLVLPDGEKLGTVGGGALEHVALKTAVTVLKEKEGLIKKYILDPECNIIDGEQTGMLCGGQITLFYEYIGSGIPLYIFGAGHIGRALVYHLKTLGYYITLLDSRDEVLKEVSGAQKSITGSYNEILKDEQVREGSYFVIATHSHQLDYLVLKRIYEANWKPAYIGLIASKKKSGTIFARLSEELGKDLDLNILYCPVGLGIGGSTPDEIAISIISELQAVRYGKQGHKHLRMNP